MQDRGEKIVTLAREILRSGDLPKSPEPPTVQIKLSFKMLCLATVITAVGSSAVTEWIVETGRPLNHYEKTELDALIFYMAHKKGINEDDVRRDVLSKMKVSSFETLTEQDFNTARTYLQDKAN